ncbi:MAG: hypothetical protein MjAS7_0993 [Metallosphaera javensis (ex Sakai et al. 2022)]|nr:MAG: hypothetical protein MjAS7_0993 [Metallosphaera javensis (ex Sakai et al. 2022)]
MVNEPRSLIREGGAVHCFNVVPLRWVKLLLMNDISNSSSI